MATIPINLFGGSGDRYLQIQLSLPPGSGVEQTIEAVTEIETRIDELSDVYTVNIGGGDTAGPGEAGGPMGLQQANIFVRLTEDAPEGIAETLRDEFEKPGRTLRISEIADGPPGRRRRDLRHGSQLRRHFRRDRGTCRLHSQH